MTDHDDLSAACRLYEAAALNTDELFSEALAELGGQPGEPLVQAARRMREERDHLVDALFELQSETLFERLKRWWRERRDYGNL